MTERGSRRRPNMIARCMKAIGYVTDPKTAPGKVFAWCERGMTSAVERLAGSDTYLRAAGAALERSFRVQARSVKIMEEALRTARLPTASDIGDLREQIRRLSDQVEAMSAQLELVVEAAEGKRRGAGAAKAPTGER